MALKFGTSGLRGLVTEMTDVECFHYTTAFLRYLKDRASPKTVALAGDHRSSTPRIMDAAGFAIQEEGLVADYCGLLPAPAVACYAMQKKMASLMVTGSHIPDDRNGIKFNMPWGEILKADEKEISDRYNKLKREMTSGQKQVNNVFSPEGNLKPESAPRWDRANESARQEYVNRYTSFFAPESLKGLKVVLYEHSSVSRDLMGEILMELGADVSTVGRSERFIPVDTEAVENLEQLSTWVRDSGADALVSTDGDGDRPLFVDETGTVVRGDIMGILVAEFLRADAVCAPVSCNTALEKCGMFKHVSRTRIGSPYVIASMLDAVKAGHRIVVGYEANGGFLTATDVSSPDTEVLLKALPTRDALLPILALLRMSAKRKKPVSGLVSHLPPRFTQSGLLREFPSETGARVVRALEENGSRLANDLFGGLLGLVEAMDFTDGARMTFGSGDVVHLRPSGNAPEFRCYTESSTSPRALEINKTALEIIGKLGW